MIPKCILLIPIDSTTGSRIGVMMIISGAISMKHPSTIRRRLMISRMIIGLSEIPISPFVTAVGILKSVIIYANAFAVAISVSTTASVLSEFLRTFPKSLILALRKIK